jgi:hypothetical protein
LFADGVAVDVINFFMPIEENEQYSLTKLLHPLKKLFPALC